MIQLTTWAADWGVPLAALRDLEQRLGIAPDVPAAQPGRSEAAVQSMATLAAHRDWGGVLWRNNVGALKDEAGRWVRYGLCNESKQRNEKFKSSDLIGIRPTLITPQHVGQTIGQFAAREIKEGDWAWSGTDREQAQLAYGQWVIRLGGDFKFYNGGPI